jgi:outer membrane lipoprotein-sorting protein
MRSVATLVVALSLGFSLAGFSQVPQPVAAAKAQAAVATQVSELGALQPAPPGETVQSVLQQIQQNVDRVKSLKAELAMSKKKEKKDKAKKKKPAPEAGTAPAGEPRSVKSGPMEIGRAHGARLALTHKDETNEYIANSELLWVYDHKAREAKYIPTSLPFISGFVDAAMKMNVFVAMDEDTIKLKGVQDVAGEPCWVLEGKSPEKLKLAGVDQVKMRFWVSQKDGIPRRIAIPTQKDLIISLNKVQINSQVDAARFNFTPPQGVAQKNIFGF